MNKPAYFYEDGAPASLGWNAGANADPWQKLEELEAIALTLRLRPPKLGETLEEYERAVLADPAVAALSLGVDPPTEEAIRYAMQRGRPLPPL